MIRTVDGDSSTCQIVPNVSTNRTNAKPYARLAPAMLTKAGRPPSSARLSVGARLPNNREHTQSEPTTARPTNSPSVRMPASLSAIPTWLHPRSTSSQRGGNESNGKLLHNSPSDGIVATLMLLVSSLQRGPALTLLRSSQVAARAVPARAIKVSILGLESRAGTIDPAVAGGVVFGTICSILFEFYSQIIICVSCCGAAEP